MGGVLRLNHIRYTLYGIRSKDVTPRTGAIDLSDYGFLIRLPNVIENHDRSKLTLSRLIPSGWGNPFGWGNLDPSTEGTWRTRLDTASGFIINWDKLRLRGTVTVEDNGRQHARSTLVETMGSKFKTTAIRYLGLLYAFVAYFLAIAYWPIFVFFIGNLPRIQEPWMQPSVSAAQTIMPTWQALAIDIGLIAAFALHHSFLARAPIKKIWGRFVAPPFRRATFTHVANIFAFAILIHWQPIPIVLWQFDHHSVLRFVILPLFTLGWLMLLFGAMSFRLTALFGLRQVWFWFNGRPYEPIDITKSRTYYIARHPEFLGLFIGLWVTPDMTVGHFILATSLTIYSFVGLGMRERELAQQFGASYESYRARVSMLGPRWATATFRALGLVIGGMAMAQTLEQRRADALARGDLHRLGQALLAYRQRHKTFPPVHRIASCEHANHRAYYDKLMARLIGGRLLDKPLVHPDRRPNELGYCYWRYMDNGRLVGLVWTSLKSSTISNAGEAGTCRPFKHRGYCDQDKSNHDYCLCLR